MTNFCKDEMDDTSLIIFLIILKLFRHSFRTAEIVAEEFARIYWLHRSGVTHFRLAVRYEHKLRGV